MKARVKATGEIIDVQHHTFIIDGGRKVERYISDEEDMFIAEDLEFEIERECVSSNEPDYWEKLKHQYAGMAMQAYIIGNQINPFGFSESPKDMEMCVSMATALVNKLKEEQK